MKVGARLVLIGGMTALLCGVLHAAAPQGLKRKPGHWEITTIAVDTGMSTIQACVGADDNVALPADSGDCSTPKITPAGSEIVVDVVCKRKYGKEIMSTAFAGDFNSRYRAVMKITYDPPEGLKNMGVTIDAKYIGPECPADSKAK
jgi:hypothetical protein